MNKITLFKRNLSDYGFSCVFDFAKVFKLFAFYTLKLISQIGTKKSA